MQYNVTISFSEEESTAELIPTPNLSPKAIMFIRFHQENG